MTSPKESDLSGKLPKPETHAASETLGPSREKLLNNVKGARKDTADLITELEIFEILLRGRRRG